MYARMHARATTATTAPRPRHDLLTSKTLAQYTARQRASGDGAERREEMEDEIVAVLAGRLALSWLENPAYDRSGAPVLPHISEGHYKVDVRQSWGGQLTARVTYDDPMLPRARARALEIIGRGTAPRQS